MSVYYNLLDENKNVVKKYVNEACYADITYHGALGDTRIKYIQLLYHKDRVRYDNKIINDWVTDIKSWGFKGFEYEGIVDNNHSFIIDVTVEPNIYKSWLISLITLIRYIYEVGICKIVGRYFELKEILKDVNNYDTFCIMQMAHKINDGNSNHALLDNLCAYSYFLKHDEFVEKANNLTVLSTKRERISINGLWRQERYKGKANNLKAVYHRLYNKVTDLYIYVVGGDINYANWLPFTVTNNIEEADIIMFTGGEDVHPSLYNERLNKNTYSNSHRDTIEKEIFNTYKDNKYFIGICRGSQFLCVMAGGKLIQHQTNNHYIHPINITKNIYRETLNSDNINKIHITSTHHQAQWPYNLSKYSYDIVGYTNNLNKYHEDSEGKSRFNSVEYKNFIANTLLPANAKIEVEICIYPDIRALAIQGHPEHIQYQQKYPEDIKKLQNIVHEFINNY